MDAVRRIADAVLYEGYLLWPYRASAHKNRQRWSFGDLEPGAAMRTQCLLEDGDPADVEVTVRFLHGTVEHEVGPGRFSLGEVSVSSERVAPHLHRLTVGISAESEVLHGTHAILRAPRGAFVSLADPPERVRAAAEACVNERLWPVLVGEPGSRDTVLAAPIILEDHPRIAPESPGDLFDSAEIDGLLTLGILALTDDEKAEIRAGDPRAREILERTEGLTREQLARLHRFRLERPGPDAVVVNGVELRRHSRVRLLPRTGGDVLDLALAGRTAIVETVEHDTEGNVSLAVTVEDDPGRDLGQQGHRYFFAPDEVEPLPLEPERAAGVRMLVAGVGNVFLGDDGFGVALAGRLARRELPAGVDVVDYGIRGIDLAYALSGYDAAVLLDATPRGGPPGTLYVIEPEVEGAAEGMDAHGMDPVKVLALARDLGELPQRLAVVGCEPQTRMSADSEEIVAVLSEPVQAALDEGVRLVESLLEEWRKGTP